MSFIAKTRLTVRLTFDMSKVKKKYHTLILEIADADLFFPKRAVLLLCICKGLSFLYQEEFSNSSPLFPVCF